MPTRTLLIIEDSDEDFEILEVILKEIGFQHRVQRFDDADLALEHLLSTPRLPSLVLLDLNMPQMDGKEFLTHLRTSERLQQLPVLALTTSQNPKDIDSCYRLGLNAYALKPVDLEKLRALIQSIVTYWFEHNVYPEILC